MNERKRTVLHLSFATAMLFIVSAYRQISLHFWSNDPIRPYIVYVVYMILLFWWQYSISTKILQKGMRIQLTMQNIVFIFYLTIRFIQDAFLYANILLMRFTGYFINILAVLVPLLGLYAAFYLGKSDTYKIKSEWYLLCIPAMILITMALTDELHHFLYYIIPEEPQPNLYFHPYIGSYLIHIWAFVLLVCQIFVIQKQSATNKIKPLYKKLIPIYQPLLLFVFCVPYFLTSYIVRFELVEFSAGLIFIVIVCWNLYILLGLIPINMQYDEVFCRSTLAMQILSLDGKVLASSENAMKITPDILFQLSKSEHLTLKDTMLNLYKSKSEYIIWQNDLSQIHGIIQELQNTNAELESEKDLIEKEIQIQTEKIEVKARNDIYNNLTNQVSNQLLLLQELLNKNPETTKEWNCIALIGIYIKRFCNLHLIYLETGQIPNKDLQISLMDMIDCMDRIGILTSLNFNPCKQMDAKLILHIMKTLEEILESYFFQLNAIEITIDDVVHFKIFEKDPSISSIHNDTYPIKVEIIQDILTE